MKNPILGKTKDGDLTLDVQSLVESRLLVQANSGAGKSWAIRRILEQTHGQVQQLVIDVEDEFHTLRERYDYILAGSTGGDCIAEPRSAGLLARRLLELNVSAILGIYELKHHQRLAFVRAFLEELVNAPRNLWHPVLVVVDEAHIFCPQHGEAESAGAVIDLMTRGRKRGFCGILATQRISKLHKDAAAEANNKLIGRAALDVDMKRAGDELGLYAREDLHRLRTLEPGRFFAFGPALTPQIQEVVVGRVQTTHPKPGQRTAPSAPARAVVRKALEQLKDIPKEAQEEIRTLQDARRKILDLERQVRAKPKEAATVSPEAIQAAKIQGLQIARGEFEVELKREDAKRTRAIQAIEGAARSLSKDSETLLRWIVEMREAKATVTAHVSPKAPPRVLHAISAMTKKAVEMRLPAEPKTFAEAEAPLTGPEQRILDALAWLASIGNSEPEQTAVAFLAGYSVGGGAFNNPRGRLRGRGLIDYHADRLILTPAGKELAKEPQAHLTPEAIQEAVMDRLPGPEQRLLKVLLEVWPAGISNEELAQRAGYEPGGGAFNNPKGRLRSLGLVDYPTKGQVKARGLLFLESGA